MELRHLRYFVAVAEEMNIHRAAKRLHISQPPLSLSIKQLEAELGIDLFTREGRGIQITRAGTLYLERARQILTDAGKAVREARDASAGISGTLKIGFTGSAATGILQNSVAAFKKKYPNVALEIVLTTTHRAPAQVADKTFDAAILRMPQAVPAALKVKTMAKESWFAAMPDKHPFCKKKHLKIMDLKDVPLVFYPRDNSPDSYDDVMQIFASHDVVPNISQETNEQIAIAGLVAAGMGIGIVPECMARIKVPGLTHRPIAGTKNRTGFALVYRDESDILVRNFLNEARL